MDIIRLLKNWTLPLAMLVGTGVYFCFAFIPALNTASVVLEPVCADLLPTLLFLVLFVNFCKVNFRQMRPMRWHLCICLVQIIASLLLAALIIGFHLGGNTLILCESALTCIIAPCAAASPVVTAKLGGNIENMTTFTLVSNLVTAMLIPLVFPLIENHADMGFWAAFSAILYRVCMVLLGPMILAYVVKHYVKPLLNAILSIRDISFYLWAACLSIVTGTTVRNIVHAQASAWVLVMIALVSLLICLAQFKWGRKLGHGFSAVVECGQALGQKNTSFAIWIAGVYLQPLASVGPGCYILWQNCVNSFELWQERRAQQMVHHS